MRSRTTTHAYRIPQMFNSIQAGGAAYARLTPLLAPALSVQGEPPISRSPSTLMWRVFGESCTVTLPVEKEQLHYLDESMQEAAERGEFELMVSGSSQMMEKITVVVKFQEMNPE